NTKQVVACIPYFRCEEYVKQAVCSLLAQTHKDIVVVVINDGDLETPPWPELSDITDPRLVRFDLAVNYGPYFALEICLRATKSPYFLIQDADDWSDLYRVEKLLYTLNND